MSLLRRLGPAATFDAVLTGFLICAHHWNFIDTTTAVDSDAWHDWDRRAQLLIPPETENDTFSTSRLFAAAYPEAIAVAELVGSLRWRRLAAGGPDDQRAFAAEIGRRLGLPDYRPLAFRDPIAHWMEQDCWQPPSLPNTNTNPPKPLKLLTAKEVAAFRVSEWVRPEPAPSSYLDTAAEPVSWPPRSGPRTPPGTRPRLPRERRDCNRALTNPLRPARTAETVN